jgi:acylphosphatase
MMTTNAHVSDEKVDAGRPAEAALEEGDLLLRVTGRVPAAEFHPFVVSVARRQGLRGWIRHHPAGALIRAVGTEDDLVHLVRALRNEAPPSVGIRSQDTEAVAVDATPVGDSFVPLVEEAIPWREPVAAAPVVADVA